MKKNTHICAFIIFLITSSSSFAQYFTVSTSTSVVTDGAVTIDYGGGTVTNNGTITNTDGTLKFSGGITFAGSGTTNTKNLIVAHSGDSSTLNNRINVTGALTVSGGTLNANDKLTLKSNATNTAVVAAVTGTISGNVSVERYIPSGYRAYRLLSSPTTGGTIKSNWQEGQENGVVGTAGFGTHITGTGGATNGFDTTASNASSVYIYNNTTPAWTAIANTSGTLTLGDPYLIYIRGSRLATNTSATTNDATTLRTTGTLHTGDSTVTVLNQTADGFSAVGNPYQAQVNMQTVLSAATNLTTGYYYVVDPSLGAKGAYYAIDVTTAATSDYSKYLQPGQACFVKTIVNGAASLTFTESSKSVVSAQTSIFKTKNTATSNIDLTLLDGNYNRLDVLRISFDGSQTNEVNENDASKMTNFDENMATFNSGKLLSIEKRALAVETDVIPLNITKYRGTYYNIKVQGTGLTGPTSYLVDTYSNKTTEIPQNASVSYAYTVDTSEPASIAADRFKITFTNSTLNTIDTAMEGFTLYPNPSKSDSFYLVVPQSMNAASITVSNLLGQKLYSQNDLQSGATTRVTVSDVKTAGVYLVRLTSQGRTSTSKWIVE